MLSQPASLRTMRPAFLPVGIHWDSMSLRLAPGKRSHRRSRGRERRWRPAARSSGKVGVEVGEEFAAAALRAQQVGERHVLGLRCGFVRHAFDCRSEARLREFVRRFAESGSRGRGYVPATTEGYSAMRARRCLSFRWGVHLRLRRYRDRSDDGTSCWLRLGWCAVSAPSGLACR